MHDAVATIAAMFSAARQDAREAVRFAAGMTVVAGVFVTVQTLLLLEETVSGWRGPTAPGGSTSPVVRA